MNYKDEINHEVKTLVTRRHFFKECGVGLGSIALASLLNEDASAKSSAIRNQNSAIQKNSLAPKTPHFAPKAKRVIYLFNSGGPSQLEVFDYKPSLEPRP